MTGDEADVQALEVPERIASALERLADRAGDSARVAELEEFLHDFVTLMQNPDSTNDEWLALLAAVKETLGIA